MKKFSTANLEPARPMSPLRRRVLSNLRRRVATKKKTTIDRGNFSNQALRPVKK